MKLKTNNEASETINIDTDVTNFKIAQNPKVATLLSKELYKDAIVSIVRELAANCQDAHNGHRVTKPFHIHIPTELEPHFSIRDYGKGLSFDEMKEIYVSYFSSTKNDTDDMIGGFGLGAKTPFSYTSMFTVTSYNNGEKSVYVCQMDGDTLPTLTILSKGEKTEETGLEIKFATKSENDIEKFLKAVESAFIYYDVKPTTNIAELKLATTTYDEEAKRDGFLINSVALGGTYGHSNVQIDIGGQPYTIYKDLGLFRDNDRKEEMLRYFVLKFNIGEISLTLSRDSIYASEKNYQKIRDKVDKYYEYVQQKIDEIVNTEKRTPFEIAMLIKEKVKLNECYKYATPTKNGEIFHHTRWDGAVITQYPVAIEIIQVDPHGTARKERTDELDLTKITFLVKDTPVRYWTRSCDYSKLKNRSETNFYIINKDDAKRCVEELGVPDERFVLISTLIDNKATTAKAARPSMSYTNDAGETIYVKPQSIKNEEIIYVDNEQLQNIKHLMEFNTLELQGDYYSRYTNIARDEALKILEKWTKDRGHTLYFTTKVEITKNKDKWQDLYKFILNYGRNLKNTEIDEMINAGVRINERYNPTQIEKDFQTACIILNNIQLILDKNKVDKLKRATDNKILKKYEKVVSMKSNEEALNSAIISISQGSSINARSIEIRNMIEAHRIKLVDDTIKIVSRFPELLELLGNDDMMLLIDDKESKFESVSFEKILKIINRGAK